MNIQPGRSFGRTRAKKSKEATPFSNQLLAIGKAVIVIASLAFVFIAQTNFRQRINDTEAKIREEKQECARLRHAIECNNIRIAQLTTWSHINAKIQHYRLNLTPIRGQVYELTQRTPAENDARFAAWQKNHQQMSSMTAKSR